jgi:TPR repeat protein
MSMKMKFLAAVWVVTSAATASGADAEAAYESGRFAVALALFEERGLEGDVRAQELVAMMHLFGPALYGKEIAADPACAARWFRAAALNGSTTSQFVLAHMYESGVGVPVNAARAEALLVEATGTHAAAGSLVTVQR